jgi:phosphocarrier protein|uniref:HPr family phosphocarrier protein n=1 Tax=Parolsenella massiliensis TaxID=1871022 RepID=UPI00093356DF|nr:HPr family phosphocarrier protein [Parolsenella massiliensis]
MYEEKFVVNNAEGLHARPASKLVELAGKYESKVEVVYKGKAVNAKSILAIMGAGIYSGSEVLLRVEGPDEQAASAELSEYMSNLPD